MGFPLARSYPRPVCRTRGSFLEDSERERAVSRWSAGEIQITFLIHANTGREVGFKWSFNGPTLAAMWLWVLTGGRP